MYFCKINNIIFILKIKKMKKLVFFMIFSVFTYSAIAQIGINPIENKFPYQPKTNEKGIEFNPRVYQKGYEKTGWLHSSTYLGNLIPESLLPLKTDIIPLLPDSCLFYYVDDTGRTLGLMGFGMNLDPYSESYSTDFDKGIFPSPPEYTYSYRLDTLVIRGAYFTGQQGYDATSPDTLRVYVSYLQPYEKIGYRTDYYTIYYLTDEHKDTLYLAPCVTVTGYDKSKGGVIKPTVDNTITIDYILTANDTSRVWDSAGSSWFRYTDITIPLTYDGITENGFEIPCGGVLSVMPTFVPGYEYEVGDTLYYGKTDEFDHNKWAKGYPIREKRYFSMLFFYMDGDQKCFADPFGYNNAIIAYRYLLYQMYFKEDGITRNFRDSSYSTHYGLLPNIYFHLSVDEENGCIINDTDNVIEANDIVSNIYPNPANDNVTIQLKSNEPASITFYSILGQEVMSAILNDNQTTIDVSNLNRGLYIVKVKQKGQTFTSKINIF